MKRLALYLSGYYSAQLDVYTVNFLHSIAILKTGITMTMSAGGVKPVSALSTTGRNASLKASSDAFPTHLLNDLPHNLCLYGWLIDNLPINCVITNNL